MFATHYLIVMIIYYKLLTATGFHDKLVFMKTASAGASRMKRTMNKALCIDVNYHFHKLNVASAEYQFSPAIPITNKIKIICVTSEITVYFFLHGHNCNKLS